jgi:hypothetical protein
LQLLIFRQDAPLISPDHATCRSDLPRERFSPLALFGHAVIPD